MWAQYWRIRRSVRRFAKGENGERILDLGSGRSPFLKDFPQMRPIRLDIERRGDVDLLGDAHELPLKDATVDIVIATEVIEHVADPKRMLDEVVRVLRPGGVLIMTWPLLWGRHETVDYQRFTVPGMRRLATNAGLDEVSVDSRGGIFTASVELMAHAPFEVAQGHLLKGFTNAVLIVWHVILAPFFLLALLFDVLDRRRGFSLGYQAKWTKRAGPASQKVSAGPALRGRRGGPSRSRPARSR